MKHWRRPVGLIVLGVIAVNLLLYGADHLFPGPSGPRSSSYATSAPGAGAYAELLRGAGHRVDRLRRRPDHAALDPRTTVVLLDPDLVLPRETRALRDFVSAGGRLVAGGREPSRWLGQILSGLPAWSPFGDRTTTGALPGIGAVASAGEGSWSGNELLEDRAVGAGRLLALADASPLQNRLLGRSDNAAFALALAGDPSRPVVFAETYHGYGESRGFGALPTRWKWALIGLGLAALALMASRARRLGPPVPVPPPLPPPRRLHVDALAGALARTGHASEAAEPVRARARELVARRAGLPRDAPERDLVTAAERIGLPRDEARSLAGDGDILAAGRALAHLNRGGGT